MNNTTAYTPLESLFLFQLLSLHGFVNGIFNQISEELKKNVLVREQKGYDAGRLSPESLQELALNLLREEQAREAEATEKNGNAGGLSPTSRKRKLPNPPSLSLKETQAHDDKLPLLVDRLYARYQVHTVRAIREDEERIESLQREIKELETAEEADKVASQQTPKAPSANGAVTGAAAAGNDVKVARPVRPNGHVNQTPVPVPTPQVQGAIKPGTTAPTPTSQPVLDRKRVSSSPSPLPPNVRLPNETRQPTPSGKLPSTAASVLQHPQVAQAYGAPPGSVTPQPQLPDGLQRPETLPKGQSPAPRPSPQPQSQTPGTLKWEPPYRPQQTPVPSPRPPYSAPATRPPSYPGPPPTGIPQQPQSQHPQGYVSNRQTPQPIAQPARLPTPGNGQPAQPVLLPPQNAGHLPPSLPSLPVHATPDGSGPQPQQYRPPSVPANGPTGTAIPVPYSAQQQPPPSHPGQTSVRVPVPVHHAKNPGHGSTGPISTGQRPIPTATGQSVQPTYSQAPLFVPATPKPQQAEGTAKSYSSPYHGGPQPSVPAEQAQQRSIPTAKPLNPVLPPIHPPSLPQTPSAISASSHVIRGHGTKWTSAPTPATPRLEISGYFDSQSPAFEPLSPPTQAAHLPKTSPQQSAKKDARKNVPKVDTSATKPKSRLSRSAQRTASEMSQAQETIEDDIGRKIKDEDATPKPFEDNDDTTADESVQGRPLSKVKSKTSNKRKRHDSPPPEIRAPPPAPPTHVLWTRSFHKVSASALEQVTSHRHANMFANPIKARDAPGYPDIILRPQDLKGIRAAINQGQRAAQAAEKNLPDADPSAMSVYLPISVDLIPPRGIVNIAQLERELVHMFANAIMYNGDPDRSVGPSFVRQRRAGSEEDDEDAIGYEVDENGIVKETRNMFVEVEKLLGDLRNEVERSAGPPAGGPSSVSRSASQAAGEASTVEGENDEPAGDVDAPSAAKRRRVRGG
ncbi:hypothetical protein BJ170DRAFT_635373 [Xylariales sp. AK1849]|nr:hypothetical protein BJ170DRAFT_635373 [Xylariales sp. AK1849]